MNSTGSTSSNPIVIPYKEIRFRFARSTGHGGHNVNKVNSKANLMFNVDQSTAFTDQEKTRIKAVLGNRMDKDGNILIIAQKSRSQLTNRKVALERLLRLITDALSLDPTRISTSVPARSRRKRLVEKRHRSNLKNLRRTKIDDYD